MSGTAWSGNPERRKESTVCVPKSVKIYSSPEAEKARPSGLFWTGMPGAAFSISISGRDRQVIRLSGETGDPKACRESREEPPERLMVFRLHNSDGTLILIEN